jgi:hypothetical protein
MAIEKEPGQICKAMLEFIKVEQMQPEIHTMQTPISIYKVNFKFLNS